MLADGLSLLSSSLLKRTMVSTTDRGNVLPSGTEGQMFELLQVDGQNLPNVYIYHDNSWKVMHPDNSILPYDFASYWEGKPEAGKVLLRFVAVRSFKFFPDLRGSVSKLGVAATANTVIMLKKNGQNMASITFAPSATVGTFTALGSLSVYVGDILTVHAPATQDATASDLMYTLAGTTIN